MWESWQNISTNLLVSYEYCSVADGEPAGSLSADPGCSGPHRARLPPTVRGHSGSSHAAGADDHVRTNPQRCSGARQTFRAPLVPVDRFRRSLRLTDRREPRRGVVRPRREVVPTACVQPCLKYEVLLSEQRSRMFFSTASSSMFIRIRPLPMPMIMGLFFF